MSCTHSDHLLLFDIRTSMGTHLRCSASRSLDKWRADARCRSISLGANAKCTIHTQICTPIIAVRCCARTLVEADVHIKSLLQCASTRAPREWCQIKSHTIAFNGKRRSMCKVSTPCSHAVLPRCCQHPYCFTAHKSSTHYTSQYLHRDQMYIKFWQLSSPVAVHAAPEISLGHPSLSDGHGVAVATPELHKSVAPDYCHQNLHF